MKHFEKQKMIGPGGKGMSMTKIYCEKIEQIKTSQSSLGKVVRVFCPSAWKAEAAGWELWG